MSGLNKKVLSWENFKKHIIDSGLKAEETISGKPHSFINYNPSKETVSFRILLQAPYKETSLLKSPQLIDLKLVKDETGNWLEFSTDEPLMFIHFFHFGMTVVKRTQEDNLDAVEAFQRTSDEFNLLLASKVEADVSVVIGLWGELWFLNHLVDKQGEEVIKSWIASLDSGEIHDFRVGKIEYEVKTTSRKNRVHIISGFEQLDATTDCNLYFVSIQCGPSGAGDGVSCRDLSEIILNKLKSAISKKLFTRLLQNSPYKNLTDEQKDIKRTLRTAPRIIEVNDSFPAINLKRLRSIFNESQLSRVVPPSLYSLNVDGLGEDIKG